MTLGRRLIAYSGSGSGFNVPPPAFVVSGPYAPADEGDPILTQLHCHTTGSDGSASPATTVGYYLGRGYEALAITDHNTVTSQPAGITTGIPGNEYGVGTSMQHIIGLDTTYNRGSETDPQTIVDGIRSNGGEAHIAHPSWIGTALSAATLAGMSNYYGIEIHNSKVIGGANAGIDPVANPGFDVPKWDAILASKKDTFAVAVDDLHQIDAFNTYDVGRVHIFVPSNTKANLITSLVRGDYVADVSNYGVTPGWPVRTDTSLSVSCIGAVRVEAWGSSGLLSATNSTSHEHEFDGSEGYVRMVAYGDYTEPFSGALPHAWAAMDGTWNVAGGVLSLAGDATGRNMVLRRHREGDFTAQIDVKLEDGGGTERAILLFNVLNEDYWYGLGFGQSTLGDFNNRLTVHYTTDANATTTLIDFDAFTASMDTWYTLKMDYVASTGRIRAKVWATGGSEPDWMIDDNDTTWHWGGFGLRANYTPDFDNLYISGFQTFYQPVAID